MDESWLSKVYSLALLSSDRCHYSFPKLEYDLAITWFTWKDDDVLNDIQGWYLCMLSLVIIKLYQEVCFGSFTIYYQWHSVLIPWPLTILRIPFPMITHTFYHHHMLFVRLIFLLPNHVSLPLSTFVFWLDYKLLASFFLCCSILLLEHVWQYIIFIIS